MAHLSNTTKDNGPFMFVPNLRDSRLNFVWFGCVCARVYVYVFLALSLCVCIPGISWQDDAWRFPPN